MFGVSRIAGVEFEPGAGWLQLQIHPAGWSASGEDVGDRREIDQVETVLVGHVPVVSVAEDDGFDLPARMDDFQQLPGVSQAGGFFGIKFVGVVVDDDEGRFVSAGVERGTQPVELGFTTAARHCVGLVQGIQNEEIGAFGWDDGDAAFDDRRLVRWEREQKMQAMIVVAECQMDRHAGTANRIEQGGERCVVGNFAGLMGEVADNKRRSWQMT